MLIISPGQIQLGIVLHAHSNDTMATPGHKRKADDEFEGNGI